MADGSPSDIQLSLDGLRQAGRIWLPDKADDCSDAARSISLELGSLDGQAARCGNPQPLLDAMAVLQDVYEGLRTAYSNLNYGAAGLLHIADDFENRDTQAAESANRLKDRVLPEVENAVTGGAQPDAAPATPEEDLEERNDTINEPSLPEAVVDAGAGS